jgi:glycogen phosphorylase
MWHLRTSQRFAHIAEVGSVDNNSPCRWNAGERVTAVAHDNPIPGFDTANTINLRLWAAKPDKEFDLEAFNTGDYVQARPRLASARKAFR